MTGAPGFSGTARHPFRGADGRLRYFWRALIFCALAVYVLPLFVTEPLILRLARLAHLSVALSAPSLAIFEFATFAVAVICTYPFARYEGRRIDGYGLPLQEAFGPRTNEGFLVGIIMAGAVAAGMYLLGGMQVQGFAIRGGDLIAFAFAWLAANMVVGVAEEYLYRGYLLQTLWRSVGFWPASLLVALVFTGDHYFFKPGENVWDVITLMSLSCFASYSVLRSGSLWFAVGFHIAFDFMQFFVIGTPNGEEIPMGRLMNVTFRGPAWLTGGVLGTEASLLMYPLIALAFVYVWWRFRGRPNLVP